ADATSGSLGPCPRYWSSKQPQSGNDPVRGRCSCRGTARRWARGHPAAAIHISVPFLSGNHVVGSCGDSFRNRQTLMRRQPLVMQPPPRGDGFGGVLRCFRRVRRRVQESPRPTKTPPPPSPRTPLSRNWSRETFQVVQAHCSEPDPRHTSIPFAFHLEPIRR